MAFYNGFNLNKDMGKISSWFFFPFAEYTTKCEFQESPVLISQIESN